MGGMKPGEIFPCQDCNQPTIMDNYNQKRCKSCNIIEERRRSRVTYVKQHPGSVQLGEIINCKYCKKPIVIKYKEETLTKAVPAEKNEISLVEKDTQTQL